jgi:hypothetical protein
MALAIKKDKPKKPTKKMFSQNFRLSDPEYIDFVPKTVEEAILKFRRLQTKGIEAWMFPEALIECGGHLPDAEMAKFESWMINPSGEPDANAMDVRDFLKAQAALDAKHGRNAMPALPEQQDDDDEKVPDMPTLVRQESGPVPEE